MWANDLVFMSRKYLVFLITEKCMHSLSVKNKVVIQIKKFEMSLHYNEKFSPMSKIVIYMMI